MNIYKTVAKYIADANKLYQPHLKTVRKIIKETVSDAKEEIAYGMPAYKWNGQPLFYFASMKGHLGLYPTSGPIETCKELLKDFSTSKGCVRVPYDKEVPKSIIVKLLKVRMKEICGK